MTVAAVVRASRCALALFHLLAAERGRSHAIAKAGRGWLAGETQQLGLVYVRNADGRSTPAVAHASVEDVPWLTGP